MDHYGGRLNAHFHFAGQFIDQPCLWCSSHAHRQPGRHLCRQRHCQLHGRRRHAGNRRCLFLHRQPRHQHACAGKPCIDGRLRWRCHEFCAAHRHRRCGHAHALAGQLRVVHQLWWQSPLQRCAQQRLLTQRQHRVPRGRRRHRQRHTGRQRGHARAGQSDGWRPSHHRTLRR